MAESEKRPQVRCPHKGCRRTVSVTTAGNLYAHSRYSRGFSGEFDTSCPVSGKNPKTWREPVSPPTGIDEPGKPG